MTAWANLCENPHFADAPFKFHLTVLGQIILTPRNMVRSALIPSIGGAIDDQKLGGKSFISLAVVTAQGVFTVDFAWFSDPSRIDMDAAAAEKAPDICVEIVSPYEPLEDLHRRGAALLKAGAKEFWIVSLGGMVSFHSTPDLTCAMPRSLLAPGVPTKIRRGDPTAACRKTVYFT